MGDPVKDGDNTKEQLVHERTELRSQNDVLEKSITENISDELAVEEARRYAEIIMETVREPRQQHREVQPRSRSFSSCAWP
jgi:hypothetical protein